MLSTAQKAMVSKELNRVTGIKGSIFLMVIEQLKVTVYFPIVLLLVPWLYSMMPHEDLYAIESFLTGLGIEAQGTSLDEMISKMVHVMMNNVMPQLLMFIPLKVGVDIAAGAVAGERANRTLETLCYSPNSISEMLQAKMVATTMLSLKVTYISFILTYMMMQLGTIIVTGAFLSFSLNWLVVLLLVIPVLAIMSSLITLKVALRAQSELEVKQKSVIYIALFVTLPVTQLMGGLLMGALANTIIALLLYGVVYYLFTSINKMSYEELLKMPCSKS